MSHERWIVIPNWPKFQHYKRRRPPWIKVYLELLHKPEYRALNLSQRGFLHGLWLAYAEADGQLRVRDIAWMFDSEDITEGATRVKRWRYIERLSHAGLIEICASKPLSLKSFKNTVTPPRRSGHVSGPAQDELVPLEVLQAYTATLRTGRLH